MFGFSLGPTFGFSSGFSLAISLGFYVRVKCQSLVQGSVLGLV